MKFSFLDKYTELQKRLIAGSIGAIFLIGGIYLSEWTYFAIFFIICLFAQLEFYKLLNLDGSRLPLRTFGTLNGLFIFVLAFLTEKYNINHELYYLAFVTLSGAYFIKLYVKSDLRPFANIGFTFLGVIYVAVPFALLNTVVFIDQKYSYQIMMGSLFILWANDTGAYFAGKNFGKRKLFLRVSPKKTWEGSIGGALLGILVGFGISYFFKDLAIWQWFGISVIIVITGTYGDLVESLFKRSINIKDSGSSIPGHGGFLDRFDGLLLSAPFIVAFLKLSGKFLTLFQ
ncbi:MAG: phosphatidate cytidylyltransferase [Bacteroidetes bacterium]|nr:MAG: phosphatidate cytidylyltransferase [Bacteroidota bacterium]